MTILPMTISLTSALVAGITTYLALLAIVPKRLRGESTQYTRNLLQQLSLQKTSDGDDSNEDSSLLRNDKYSNDLLSQIFFKLPGSSGLYPRLLKAGIASNTSNFIIRCLIALVVAAYLFKRFFPWNIPIAIIIAFIYGHIHIKRRIDKRNSAFLNDFPDALDMIVRSVRSGYPLNSSVRMIADNMQPPISTEFKQVADEIAYGSTLIEALQRLALRIDEPDVQFFVVVLSVQNDIGGNLSEVLNNLGGIIRKRKHLRMKIKALTSEGRTSAWVLGSMPFVETALILLVSPNHLDPLFDNHLGNMVLLGTIGIISIGIFVVNRMVNIKV